MGNDDVTAAAHGASPALRAQDGDVVIEEIGEFTTKDGRKIFGILLTAPAEPPPIKLSHVFNRTPFRLVQSYQSNCDQPRGLSAAEAPVERRVNPNHIKDAGNGK